MSRSNSNSGSNSSKRERRIRVVARPRKEPDVRRIARAIVALSLDVQDADDRFAELANTERGIARRRRIQVQDEHDKPEGSGS